MDWVKDSVMENLRKFECLSQMTENIMIQEKLRTSDLRKLTRNRASNQERGVPKKLCDVLKLFKNVSAADLGILWVTL